MVAVAGYRAATQFGVETIGNVGIGGVGGAADGKAERVPLGTVDPDGGAEPETDELAVARTPARTKPCRDGARVAVVGTGVVETDGSSDVPLNQPFVASAQGYRFPCGGFATITGGRGPLIFGVGTFAVRRRTASFERPVLVGRAGVIRRHSG